MEIRATLSMVMLAAFGVAQTPVAVPTVRKVEGPRLCVLLPEARRPIRDALRVVDRIVADGGHALEVLLVWPDAEVRARSGRRGPTGTRDLVDPRGTVRASLSPDGPRDVAVGVWWDADGSLVLIEPIDGGARHLAEDLREAGTPGVRWHGWVEEVRAAIDAPRVRRILVDASEALAGRPEYLARVVDAAAGQALTIGRDPVVRAIVARMVDDAPRCEAVQRAAFRVWHGCRDVDAARQAGFVWIECVKGRQVAARALVDTVREADDRGAYPELLDVAFQIAIETAPDDASLQRLALDHRLRERGDLVGAARAGRAFVSAVGADAEVLNGFAWKMLTEEPYAGVLDGLALHAARAMTEDPDWRTYWRVDTLAMACYRNDLLDEAVALQREAVGAADTSSRPRYQERLETYVAALARASAAAPPSSR